MTAAAAVPNLGSGVAAVASPRAITWQIDPAHTHVEFAVKHLMIATVKGRFATLSGRITIDEAEPAKSSAEIEIDASSIDTREDQRDAHLRSADFLDVERYPALTFKSRRVELSDSDVDRFRIVGDLTIRGVTREIVFDAEYLGQINDPFGGTRAAFSATTRLNRKDFGLNWNVALEAGGVLVGEEVRIALEIEAVKAA